MPASKALQQMKPCSRRWRCVRAGVLAIAIAACGGERPAAVYPTRADAEASGAFARGWLPAWIPEAAVNIHEVHDLDTNEVCIRFELARDRRAGAQLGVRISDAEIGALAAPCSLRPRWWFSNLVQQAPADDWALNAELFTARGTPPHAEFIIAADRLSDTIYVWSR